MTPNKYLEGRDNSYVQLVGSWYRLPASLQNDLEWIAVHNLLHLFITVKVLYILDVLTEVVSIEHKISEAS